MTPDEERARVLVDRWVRLERMEYADKKWAENPDNRAEAISRMREADFDWWTDYVQQYLHRSRLLGWETPQGRQALGKTLQTLHHLVETAVLVFGDMPDPGHESGHIEEWNV